MLPPFTRDEGERPQLSKAVERDAVVVLRVWHVVLPHGGDEHVMAASVKFPCDQAALDLCAADERRVVVCG